MHEDPQPSKDAVPGPTWSEVEELLGRMSLLHHKINNPLTSLMGRAQMLPIKLRQGDTEQVAKAAEVIEESSRRLAALVLELARAVSEARERFRDPAQRP
jgi:signal transduction histidine kinase